MIKIKTDAAPGNYGRLSFLIPCALIIREDGNHEFVPIGPKGLDHYEFKYEKRGDVENCSLRTVMKLDQTIEAGNPEED